MKAHILKVLPLLFIACTAVTLSVITSSALSQNLAYYNTEFAKSSVPGKQLAIIAQAQVGKTTGSLRYNTAWCNYFVGDCARLAGIPKEIIPDVASSDEMYHTLIEELDAKVVDIANIRPGDIMFVFDSNGIMGHTGIVFNEDQTVEGNITNPEGGTFVGVWNRKILTNWTNVLYVRPAYSKMSQKYTIKFDTESTGKKLDSIKKSFAEPVTIPEDIPEKEGRYFLGWALEKDGTVKYVPGATYHENESATLYAVWVEEAPRRYETALPGGQTHFGVEEIMYPGDEGTQFHNAIAKPDVWSPVSGQYEDFFGIKTEKAVYRNLNCVKVSLLEGFNQGYFDFNYYQHDCGYYMPSLDASKYKWLKIVYAYNEGDVGIDNMSFFASKDVALGTTLHTATKSFDIINGQGNWQEVTIGLEDLVFSDRTAWSDNTIRQFRIKMFEGNQYNDAVCYIAGFAFFETKEAADEWKILAPITSASQTVEPDYSLGDGKYSRPTTGGRTLFGVSEMMYEGDKGTQFHGAFAKSDIPNPINGRYENYFGTKMEKSTHLKRSCVKVSLISGITDGYLDFNYYQWNSEYYRPSLDGSKYKYIAVNYAYPDSTKVPSRIKFFASKDVYPLGASNLQSANYYAPLTYTKGKWNKAVINLSKLSFPDGTTWEESTIRQWRLHFFDGNTDLNAKVYISSIGFFETEEEALAWDGDTNVSDKK